MIRFKRYRDICPSQAYGNLVKLAYRLARFARNENSA